MFLWPIFLFVSAANSAGCPFLKSFKTETEENLYHQSLYTKGLDEETQKRPDPTQKNNYGHCQNNECVLNSRFRTFNGICNNIVTNKNFGRSPSTLIRLIPTVRNFTYDKNNQLPNPRKISSLIHGSNTLSKNDQRYHLYLFFYK